MKNIKDLKQEYIDLPRPQKEVIGSALVKVNVGVAQPADLKIAAAFLKGSEFIAKAGKLNRLISSLQGDVESSANGETVSLVSNMSETEVKNISSFSEDEQTTSTDIKK